MTIDDEKITAEQTPAGLHAHHDARSIVRLFQCSLCSYPLREPMILPCGNSICKRCLPPVFKRENISYPLDAARAEGVVCPFRACGLQHALDDCSLDVTLNKMVETVRTHVDLCRKQASDTSLRLDEILHWPDLVESSIDIMPRSRVLPGGRIVATYVLADMGELDFSSEVTYTTIEPDESSHMEALDTAVVDKIKEIVQGEVECHVCYSLMLDPLTTSCGHSFCRRCVARVLDHTNLCPACRRRLAILPGVSTEPTNKRLAALLANLLPGPLAARIALAQQEDAVDEEASIPLFPCTLAFPLMPTFLHIFEPRYRLMIRRCVENGSRKFGILAYNQFREPQGSLGRTPFLQYGTVLHVQRVEMFPDGRSLIETTGAYRFRVLEHTVLDGYIVGKIQRIDDVSLAEEEAMEAQETGAGTPEHQENDDGDAETRFDRMSTQELLQYGLSFIHSARSQSANWLHDRVLAAYGQPPSDPALFPYWFASVLPIAEREKYLLLPTTSVRQRLKLTARWINRLEQARRTHDNLLARTVLDSSSDEEEIEDEDTVETDIQPNSSAQLGGEGPTHAVQEAPPLSPPQSAEQLANITPTLVPENAGTRSSESSSDQC